MYYIIWILDLFDVFNIVLIVKFLFKTFIICKMYAIIVWNKKTLIQYKAIEWNFYYVEFNVLLFSQIICMFFCVNCSCLYLFFSIICVDFYSDRLKQIEFYLYIENVHQIIHARFKILLWILINKTQSKFVQFLQ